MRIFSHRRLQCSTTVALRDKNTHGLFGRYTHSPTYLYMRAHVCRVESRTYDGCDIIKYNYMYNIFIIVIWYIAKIYYEAIRYGIHFGRDDRTSQNRYMVTGWSVHTSAETLLGTRHRVCTRLSYVRCRLSYIIIYILFVDSQVLRPRDR